MSWLDNLPCALKRNEPLASHTTFRIGGNARLFLYPSDDDDLKLLINYLKRYKIHPVVMGAGSNILAPDHTFNAAVICLRGPHFSHVSVRGRILDARAGCMLGSAAREAARKKLAGLECMAGIPGTLGGALVMNAGAWGYDISGLVKSVTVMDYRGTRKVLTKEEAGFTYRGSSLGRYIILGAELSLAKASGNKSRIAMARYLALRKKTQDLAYPSAGSVFKNPKGYSAGALIDLCGLRGRRKGRAMISIKHANFIVNLGGAKAQEVRFLIALAQARVKKKFGIMLEPEIQIWK